MLRLRTIEQYAKAAEKVFLDARDEGAGDTIMPTLHFKVDDETFELLMTEWWAKINHHPSGLQYVFNPVAELWWGPHVKIKLENYSRAHGQTNSF